MDWDDQVYLALLFFSVGFGYFFRDISDPAAKKWTSTFVGLGIVSIVCGTGIWHSIVLTAFHAALITANVNKFMHIISFVVSFAYLFFFRFADSYGLPEPSGHANLVQMILTLKLVGLTFEVKDCSDGEQQGDASSVFAYKKFPRPTAVDVFHYAYSYAGVMTGPYYSYRTYLDMFRTPFAKTAGCWNELARRLLVIPIAGVVHILANKWWPFEYALSEEFYAERSLFYRIWYTVPAFVQFRTRIYIGLRLSEAVCIMAGIGCYPAATAPRPGRGPTQEFESIGDQVSLRDDVACNYDTVHSLNLNTEVEARVRTSMKHWNMTVQFWLAEFVYHRFPIKSYRVLATFVVSSYWHGFYAGYYFTLCSVPVYLILEDKVYRQVKDWNYDSALGLLVGALGSLYKLFLMGYWGFFFRLRTFDASWRYICSIGFLPHVVTMVGAYALGEFLARRGRKSRKDELSSHDKSQ